MTKRFVIFLIFLSILIVPTYNLRAAYFLAEVRDHLRQSLEDDGMPAQHFYDDMLLSRFYESRNFMPAWIGTTGISPQAEDLIRAIREADREGLRRDNYHFAKISRLAELIRDSENLINAPDIYVEFDLLMTDAFFTYASHLSSGHVDSETIRVKWGSNGQGPNLVRILQEALDSDSVRPVLKRLSPTRRGYSMLRYELMHYRFIARHGGWKPIPEGPMMRKGDWGRRVELLRNHLLLTEDLRIGSYEDIDVFDEDLESAVIKYQRRHGLKMDGVVGPETLAWLNIPVDELVKKIRLNMERWRWLSRDRGEIYIVVNIADFKLDVINNDESELSMRVIVGSNYRMTPVFSSNITHIVVNPYWYVPPVIAAKDVLPAVKKNPDYLAVRNMRIYKDWSAKDPEIDPATIDWSTVDAENFEYKFRQDPGPLNPLGNIKFFLPNKYFVFLHDTPERRLFKMSKRVFSSGCIRLEKPFELAAYFYKDTAMEQWEDIASAYESGERKVSHLPEPVPIYLLYWTAWVDDAMELNFRDDIYNRDSILNDALNERPPIYEQ